MIAMGADYQTIEPCQPSSERGCLVAISDLFMSPGDWDELIPQDVERQDVLKLKCSDFTGPGGAETIANVFKGPCHGPSREIDLVAYGVGVDFAIGSLAACTSVRSVTLVSPMSLSDGSMYRSHYLRNILQNCIPGRVDELFDLVYLLFYSRSSILANGIAGYLAQKARFKERTCIETTRAVLQHLLDRGPPLVLPLKSCPAVHIVHGSESRRFGTRDIQYLCRFGVEPISECIPGAADLPHIEQPVAFRRAIRRSFRRTASAS